MEGAMAVVTRYVDEFSAALREDPLKAAGLAALGLIALVLLAKTLRLAWRLRWLLAVLGAVGGVGYLVYAKRARNAEQEMLAAFDDPEPTSVASGDVADPQD